MSAWESVWFRKCEETFVVGVVLPAFWSSSECVPVVWGQSSLGTAQAFAVLGGSTVTNTGASVITGDLGVSPGSAVTGFPPGIVTGTIHAANATALQAQNDVTTQYNSLASAACPANLTGQNLGGLTLTPGVYCFNTSAQLTGTLTLDAQGSAGATFIFKTGSTLTTASASSVLLINGGNPCGVAWQIGSSATLGTTTSFIGNLIALTSITLNTDANIIGRALARNGAVTLDSNNISFAACGRRTAASPNSLAVDDDWVGWSAVFDRSCRPPPTAKANLKLNW